MSRQIAVLAVLRESKRERERESERGREREREREGERSAHDGSYIVIRASRRLSAREYTLSNSACPEDNVLLDNLYVTVYREFTKENEYLTCFCNTVGTQIKSPGLKTGENSRSCKVGY